MPVFVLSNNFEANKKLSRIFGGNVVPLDATTLSYFSISCHLSNTAASEVKHYYRQSGLFQTIPHAHIFIFS
jgi:hypothetical protein